MGRLWVTWVGAIYSGSVTPGGRVGGGGGGEPLKTPKVILHFVPVWLKIGITTMTWHN